MAVRTMLNLPQCLHPDLVVILPPSAVACIHRQWCLWLLHWAHLYTTPG